MQDSDRAYDQILGLLEERQPGLALQIRAEVARGRPTSGARISAEDRADRSFGLKQASFSGLGQKDVVVIEYTYDDRLVLALEAIRRLSASMLASRQALLDLLRRHDVPSSEVIFSAPDETDTGEVRVDLDNEVGEKGQTLSRSSTNLTSVVSDVRGQS